MSVSTEDDDVETRRLPLAERASDIVAASETAVHEAVVEPATGEPVEAEASDTEVMEPAPAEDEASDDAVPPTDVLPVLPDRAWEDTDSAWGDRSGDDDDRILRERPPHW
ncbi:hypothetical protein [Salana multivorans]